MTVTAAEGKKTFKNPEAAFLQNPRQLGNAKAEAWRFFWPGAGFTSSDVSASTADSKPRLRYILSIDPPQQYTASPLVFMLKSVSRKVSDLFTHPQPENILLLEVQEIPMLFL